MCKQTAVSSEVKMWYDEIKSEVEIKGNNVIHLNTLTSAKIKETMKPMTVDKFPSPDYGKIYGRFLLTISLLSMWLNFTLTHPRDSLTTWQSRDIKGMDFQNRTKRSRRGKIGERREEEATKEKLSEQDIIQKVMDGYDWRVRPRGLNASIPDTGGPVIVNVNIMMRSISKVDDVNMEYSVQFTFREQWVDSRLAYKNMVSSGVAMPKFVVLTPNDQSQQVWMPDTFFQNEKEARRHMIDKPNVMIRIYPDGEMLYSVRLSLVLSCPMSLEYYPLDRQTCLIDLASYGYTTEDIKYEWKEDGPVQLKDGLKNSLPSFELQDVTTGFCTSKTNTGEYSCLRTVLILQREFSYYLLQLYIPSFMLVIVSWVSFWLEKESVAARVTLGITTLLTITTQASGINANLPPVSYTKAIDVWIEVCVAFIFCALLEFALVNYAARKDNIEAMNRAAYSSSKMVQFGYKNFAIAPFKEMDESCVQDDICQFDVLQRAFRLSHITADSPYYISSEYSCLRTILTLKREYSYYLITLYIPSFMLVVVSWVNFWIDKDAVPARVSLGVTTLLTMTTQASGVNAKLPPVSYTKAIDVWIGVCLAFIFGALLEFALVNYAGRVEFLEKERRKQKVNLLTDNRWLPTVALPFMMQQSSSAANPAGTFMQTRQSTQIPQMQRQMPAADGFSIEAMCPECKAEQSEKKKVHDWEVMSILDTISSLLYIVQFIHYATRQV
ncbi:Glutamate-gated chloride channel [Trichinella pseudospiralis]|uniref:Glutamate-gated chloride channel n=1 Tax=Trichinella pseudospiralis TaxID=6337 RepID=A0A0V0YAH8_TRIPS|nr:Glutamate-gated chloride channel [Trichinella pseudospiralis]KRY72573.1 Glutamate-gated chloride channel [Trichinella pseudospiralis]KRZ29183.1 Glutamate-gated chloride channel [Trichinella pseudospiralis]